jgi:hypothetical protein
MASTEFRQPERVSMDEFTDASLVVSGGSPHIAAVGRNGIWYFTRVNGAWVGEKLTHFSRSVNSPRHGAPAIAADPTDGSLTVVYERQVPQNLVGGCDVLGLYSLHKGSGNWSSFGTSLGGEASRCMMNPSLLVVDGHMYVAAAVGTVPVPGAPQRVRYLTDVTGDWTSEELRGSGAASLARDSHGNPHLAGQRFIRVNEDEVSWVIWHARGKSPTGNFVKERIAEVTDLTSTASLALSITNKPRVAWSEPDGIHYALKTLSGWHQETIAPNLSVTDLVIDPFGFAHMTATGPGGLWYVTGPQNGGAGDFDATNVTNGFNGDIALSQNNTVQIAFQRGDETWWVRSKP